MISGFVDPDKGDIILEGELVNALPPEQRGVGIVFQSYALFPHLDVKRNIGYGLRARGVPRTGHAGRIAEMLRLVRMEEFASRYPRQLSGGQQQRVALARALAVEPSVLLLDEPFAALDKGLRLEMQIELKRIQRDAAITTIMVTHDQDEALALADRVAVFNAGNLEQLGTPQEIYDAPNSLFVSKFVGDTNLLGGRLCENGPGGARIALDLGGDFRLAQSRPCGRLGRVIISIRPENVRVTAPASGLLRGHIRSVLARGPTVAYEIALADDFSMRSVEMRGTSPPVQVGTLVGLEVTEPGRCPVYLA
jgi:putative spermidine/putrescine transport system ATP-binding protein